LILLIISALFLTLGFLELLGVVDPSFAAFFEDLSKDPNHLFNYTTIQLSYILAILLLIILPTLIIYIRLGFVNYLIIDKEIEVGNAFMLSYQSTKGKLGFVVFGYHSTKYNRSSLFINWRFVYDSYVIYGNFFGLSLLISKRDVR
jgi:hypothetical protein